MGTKKSNQIYQIKVTLDNIRPPIWRRIHIPGKTTLFQLHEILLIAMGWEGYHLHQFLIDEDYYGDPEDDEYGDFGIKSEKRYKINQLASEEGARFKYEYDFGDGWEHTLLVEKIMPPEKGVTYPRCIKGKRACPPEDVGGPWGYMEFLEAIKDPDHPEHDEMLEWAGDDFDAEAFDIDEVNAILAGPSAGNLHDELRSEALDSQQVVEILPALDRWIQQFDQEQFDLTEKMPIRRDMISLLSYVRDHKVTGTQSTGNFPLKVVHEISAQLVNPPKLEETVGERVFKIRSENDVLPLYSLHVLAAEAGLLEGGMSRRWLVTPQGQEFMTAAPPAQVWFLFSVWYVQSDWTIFYPFIGLGESLPVRFRQGAFTHLNALPAGEWVPFEPFADELIKATGLIWTSPDQSFHRMALHGAVERMVIDNLVKFCVLEKEYGQKDIGGSSFQVLTAFRITSFGKGLLETISSAFLNSEIS